MDELKKIKEELREISQRNKRVEADKAWETSVFRVVSITLITYIIAVAVMWGIGVENPWTGALIPTIGYFLSTQSLPIIKRWWIKRRLKR
jgi:hypothetical protein